MNIPWNDGHFYSVIWQKCRKADARALIKANMNREDGGNDIDELLEEAGPPAQATQQAAQPQGTQGESSGAAGPSSAQQPVPQQQQDTAGGVKMVPGPFGKPVPAPGVALPTEQQQYMPYTEGMMSGYEGMGYAPGSQYMGGMSGTQGMGYSYGMGHSQDTPFAGGYGGGQTGMSSAGGYGDEYDMPFGDDYGGDYGDVGGYPMAGVSMASGGNTVPAQGSTSAPPAGDQTVWTDVKPGVLYHSEETEGVDPDQPHYKALPTVWSSTDYSKF